MSQENILRQRLYISRCSETFLPYLRNGHKRLIEDLLSFETGHIVIRVADGQQLEL